MKRRQSTPKKIKLKSSNIHFLFIFIVKRKRKSLQVENVELGQGWRPLRSETAANSARAGAAPQLRAPLRRGTGALRPGGSSAHSHCHNLLPRLLGVPFGSVVRGQAGDRRRPAAASPRPPTDGRERRGRDPLRPSCGAAAGRALRKVPAWGTCHRLLPRRGA